MGDASGDRVGNSFIQQFSFPNNGKYYVTTSAWHSSAGVVTWIDGAAPLVGAVSSANSLVGSTANDQVGSAGVRDIGSGKSLVVSPNWSNGTATNAGAVTWIDAAAPITGVVSSANSLVGVNLGDGVGSGGVNPNGTLASGDYIVSSPSFGGVGALTVGSKSGGISGVVSGANSLIGFGTNYQLANSNTRLLVGAPNASSGGFTNNGRLCLYAGGAGCAGGTTLGPQLYADNTGASVTITPAQITAMTNNGTNVLLQASSDITLDALSDIVTNNPSGAGGDLKLQAGRSIFLNSNIFTDDGNLTIIANDSTANGVVAANRDAGTAEITMADGTKLDAGAGRVDIQLRDGFGHSGFHDSASSINLRSITAASLSVKTDFGGIKVGDPAALLPSDINITGDATLIAATSILFAGGRVPGAFSQLSANGQITIDPPTLELRPGASYARIVNPNQLFPIILTVSDCIGCAFNSSFEISTVVQPVSVSSSVNLANLANLADLAAQGLLSLNPNSLDQIEDTKKSKGEIEIEGGETCK